MRCPDCGSSLEVPRLGELVTLETSAESPAEESAAAGVRDWNAAQALLLAGVVTAVVAVAAAGWLRGRRAGVAPIDETAIRAVVAAAPSDRVHAFWLEFERQGIGRPPVREEELRLRHAQALAALETAAWITVGAGCSAAAAAFIVGRMRRRGAASR